MSPINLTYTGMLPGVKKRRKKEAPPSTTHKPTVLTMLRPPVTILSSLYGVEKAALGEAELTRVRKHLTAVQKDWYDSAKSLSYPLYQEDERFLWTPRFYGLQKWGAPTHNQLQTGIPMQDGVTFHARLDETRHQQTSFDRIVKAFRDPLAGGGMLCLPCGFGKTVVSLAAAIEGVRQVHGTPVKTMVLLHKDDSVEQWRERIGQYVHGVRVGVLQGSKCEIKETDLVLAMVQSLASRSYPDLDDIGLLVVDEGHHMAAPNFKNALAKIRPKWILCLTATPQRADGLQYVLHMYMGPILFQTTRAITGKERVRMVKYVDPSQREISTKSGKPLTAVMHKRMRMD
ncbi:MAG TPA: DEAD/DEAH box helicase family protein, partial [Candidatus Obscuribacterales bacterium]